MKKLLNTLYLNQENYNLHLKGEQVEVFMGNQRVGAFPLLNLESIVTHGRTGASPQLIAACLERGIILHFLSPYGKYLGRIDGREQGNVLLRRAQYRVADCDEEATRIARNMIFAKVYNQRYLLERMRRDHALRIEMQQLQAQSLYLKQHLPSLRQVETGEQLRAIEGKLGQAYFSVFDEMILQKDPFFHFSKRLRRPAKNATNALLSYFYTLLAAICVSALESVGLDPYVGFLHCDRPGRASLALDLMEEFRAQFADRFVLRLINRHEVQKSDFTLREEGAVILKEDSRKKLLSKWQEYKQSDCWHPFLEEKVSRGMLPYCQALLLSRYLRGDLDEYPSYLQGD